MNEQGCAEAHAHPYDSTRTASVDRTHYFPAGAIAQMIVARTPPLVSIILPTTCESRRAKSLWTAVKSILRQDGVAIDAIVVVNGDRYDRKLLEELRADGRLRVFYRPVAGLPKALKFGRSMIQGEYFGFLDDDDELLTDALATRLELMLRDSTTNVVVSNGFVRCVGTQGMSDRPYINNLNDVILDPMLSLLSHNWLASCGGLFRASSITEDYFDDQIPYNEWTLVAFKLCTRAHLAFLTTPTFRVNETSDSLSRTRTEASMSAPLATICAMLQLSSRSDVTLKLERKLGAAWHSLAEFYRTHGRRREAWNCHMRSLSLPGRTRYLAYTRVFAGLG